MLSMNHILESDLIRNIVCEHNRSHDLFTGPDPVYHSHDAYEIYFFVQGSTRLYVEQGCFELTPGDCIVIRPGQMHRCIVTDTAPYERISLYISSGALRILSTETTDLERCFRDRICRERGGSIHVSAYESKRYIQSADRYVEARASGAFGSDWMSLSYLMELLLFIHHLFGHSGEWDRDDIMPPIVSGAMEYVREHLTEKISLASMSRALNYSSHYISLQFKRHTGLSLREYILEQKIERAKKLLRSGSSVTGAGEGAGFNDYANFIRSFKKQVGIPPGQYKKNRIFDKPADSRYNE